MNKTLLITLISILLYKGQTFAQPLQNIKGEVKDIESQYPLGYIMVYLMQDSILVKQTETDEQGKYKLETIPVGRYKIIFRGLGYESVTQNNLILTSAKELVVNTWMKETLSKQTKEIVIEGKKKGEVRNEMSLVSIRSFQIEETEKYAGSRGDPARMASNFAGVLGNNDSRNDIIIRGNSPLGVLYRVEEMDIFNPNHFGIAGTTGGPVSIINNKTLSNSDFLTGAFSSEYGNALAGVFDLRMRNGNSEKTEYTGQLGFLGTELSIEGPLGLKQGASYMAVYRYSTLKIFEKLKLPIGTDAVPNYQDGAFKLFIPINDKANVSVFGLGGFSNIDINVSRLTEPPKDIYSEATKDQFFQSGMGVVGANFGYTINKNTYFKVVLSYQKQHTRAIHDLVTRDSQYKVSQIYPVLWYTFNMDRIMMNSYINHKINPKNTVKAGIILERQGFNLLDSFIPYLQTQWIKRWDYLGSAYFSQAYGQWKHQFSDKLQSTLGIHFNHYTLNNQALIEPRAGLRYALSGTENLSLGYGLHSQTQPSYVYFYFLSQNSNSQHRHNEQIGMNRSHHLVASYDKLISEKIRFRTEAYYQYLFDVPVEKRISSFSLLNQGSAFSRFFPDTLVNKGLGRNYGIELTLERNFSNGFFYLLTGSLFNSEYQGSDKVWRNTDFNSNYAFNGLTAYEWKLNSRSIFQLGSKITYSGGRRYSAIDTLETEKQGEIIYDDKTRNSKQFRPYFRWDIKILYRVNKDKITQEVGLDLVNLLNTKNLLGFTYSPGAPNPMRQDYQLGFLPLFYYKIDF